MRLTAAQLREVARDGAAWRPPEPGSDNRPSPAAIRTRAVAIYHEEGHAAALSYLGGQRPGVKGLATGYFGPGGKAAGWGRQTRRSLDRYFDYDRREGQLYAELSLKEDVALGTHFIGAFVDVVLFHPQGYLGRVLSWDQAGVPTLEAADLVAAPAAMLIEQEMGEGTCAVVAVWDLPNKRQYEIDGQQALGTASQLKALMNRIEGAL